LSVSFAVIQVFQGRNWFTLYNKVVLIAVDYLVYKILLPALIVISIIYITLLTLVYVLQSSFIFYPEKLEKNFVYEFRERFEERNYKVGSNNINALLFKVKNPKGVILYFHGNAGSLRSWGSIFSDFSSLGYDMLIYDYHGYGKSTGRVSEKKLYQTAQYLYQQLKKEYTAKKVILYGRSIGSAIAAKIASENSVSLTILESPYYSMGLLAATYYPWVPRFSLRFKLDTCKYLQKSASQVVLFHGTSDEVIAFEHSLKLVDCLTTKPILYAIQAAGHNNLNQFPEYHTALKKIFQNLD